MEGRVVNPGSAIRVKIRESSAPRQQTIQMVARIL